MAELFFLDVIHDALVADFAARGRVAEVLIGEWDTVLKYPGDVVVLGLGDGEGEVIGADAHHYSGEVDQGDGTSARALCADRQRMIVWCSGRPPVDATADLARLARAATMSLLRATIAAIWRCHGGAFPWGRVKWLNEARGSRIYGGAVRFEAEFPIPIWDDATDLFTPDESEGAAETVIDDVPIQEAPNWTDP